MDVKEIVNKIFQERFEIPYSDLKPEAHLRNDLNLDSLDYIEMIVFIEKNMSFKVNRDDLKNVNTLQDVYNLVENTLKDLTRKPTP